MQSPKNKESNIAGNKGFKPINWSDSEAEEAGDFEELWGSDDDVADNTHDDDEELKNELALSNVDTDEKEPLVDNEGVSASSLNDTDTNDKETIVDHKRRSASLTSIPSNSDPSQGTSSSTISAPRVDQSAKPIQIPGKSTSRTVSTDMDVTPTNEEDVTPTNEESDAILTFKERMSSRRPSSHQTFNDGLKLPIANTGNTSSQAQPNRNSPPGAADADLPEEDPLLREWAAYKPSTANINVAPVVYGQGQIIQGETNRKDSSSEEESNTSDSDSSAEEDGGAYAYHGKGLWDDSSSEEEGNNTDSDSSADEDKSDNASQSSSMKRASLPIPVVGSHNQSVGGQQRKGNSHSRKRATSVLVKKASSVVTSGKDELSKAPEDNSNASSLEKNTSEGVRSEKDELSKAPEDSSNASSLEKKMSAGVIAEKDKLLEIPEDNLNEFALDIMALSRLLLGQSPLSDDDLGMSLIKESGKTLLNINKEVTHYKNEIIQILHKKKIEKANEAISDTVVIVEQAPLKKELQKICVFQQQLLSTLQSVVPVRSEREVVGKANHRIFADIVPKSSSSSGGGGVAPDGLHKYDQNEQMLKQFAREIIVIRKQLENNRLFLEKTSSFIENLEALCQLLNRKLHEKKSNPDDKSEFEKRFTITKDQINAYFNAKNANSANKEDGDILLNLHLKLLDLSKAIKTLTGRMEIVDSFKKGLKHLKALHAKALSKVPREQQSLVEKCDASLQEIHLVLGYIKQIIFYTLDKKDITIQANTIYFYLVRLQDELARNSFLPWPEADFHAMKITKLTGELFTSNLSTTDKLERLFICEWDIEGITVCNEDIHKLLEKQKQDLGTIEYKEYVNKKLLELASNYYYLVTHPVIAPFDNNREELNKVCCSLMRMIWRLGGQKAYHAIIIPLFLIYDCISEVEALDTDVSKINSVLNLNNASEMSELGRITALIMCPHEVKDFKQFTQKREAQTEINFKEYQKGIIVSASSSEASSSTLSTQSESLVISGESIESSSSDLQPQSKPLNINKQEFPSVEFSVSIYSQSPPSTFFTSALSASLAINKNTDNLNLNKANLQNNGMSVSPK